jgi:hypothetical protein
MAREIGAAAGDADAPAVTGQRAHDMAADETGAAEDRHHTASPVACLKHHLPRVCSFAITLAD